MADDLFYESDDSDDAGNATLESLRGNQKELSKALRAERKRAAELEAKVLVYEAQQRNQAARAVFQAKGLPTKFADLYLRVNQEGEVTPEGVTAFVQEYGLIPSTPEPEAEAEAEGADQAPVQDETPQYVQGMEFDLGTTQGGIEAFRRAGAEFVPVVGSPAEGKKMSVAEFQKVYAKEGVRALRLIRDGQVEGLQEGTQANI